jgi:alkanesulfonate monooxygenase SsuD/methylene tetrahydromethanopterin reductase-like flavin-dependent oxidoreductase (luciferase family)
MTGDLANRPQLQRRPPGPFGLSLPNRAVLFGAITVQDMYEMTELAESSGFFDSVWVGDSLLAKPRLEAIALLAALAARTERMQLGPACLASFPLRDLLILAQQWGSLDVISGGRTIMVPCIGSSIKGAGGAMEQEYRAFKADPGTRVARFEEAIPLLRRLWSEDSVTHHGEWFDYEDVTILPKPAPPAPPIWIASDPALAKPHLAERAFRRVARLADGWMTSMGTPDELAQRWQMISGFAREEGRDPSTMHVAVHHMVNINDDRQVAYTEAKTFLDKYYETDSTPERMETWVSYGTPAEVADKIGGYLAAGAGTMILRFASWTPIEQIRRAVDEVLPRLMTPKG